MISLTKAVKLYNEEGSKNFWDFIANQLLTTEVKKYAPAFITKVFDKKISKLKAKAISKGINLSEITSNTKRIVKSEKYKKFTFFLIKYTWPEYKEYLKEKHKKEKAEVIFKDENITIHANKVCNAEFNFLSKDPIIELRFNSKTRSVSLKTLCSSSVEENRSKYWYKKDLTVDYKIIDYENVLVLLFRYHIVRKGANYRQKFWHNSDYLLINGLYIIKEPFYVIESKKRFFYNSTKPSLFETSDLKEIIKKLKPRHEKDIPIFKNLILSSKKKNPALLYESTGRL